MTSETLVIVNETSGNGAMADIFRRLEHRLIDAIGPIDVTFTDRPGHATDLARRGLRDGATLLIAAGGDGTLSEVVGGTFDEDGAPINPEARVALLIGGTGGDFRRSVRIGDEDTAIAAIAGGKTRAIDVGRLTYRTFAGADANRIFINIASFGIGGLVDRYVGAFKRLPGRLAYAAATLRSLWGWRNPRITLAIDDTFEAELPAIMVAVANGRFFGGGMHIAPDARLDSGEFGVTIVGDVSRLELIAMTNSIYAGSHIYHPKVIVKSGRVITATTIGDIPALLDVDGEPLGMLPARFEVIPGALNLVVPDN